MLLNPLRVPSTDFQAVRDGRETGPFSIELSLDLGLENVAVNIAGNIFYVDKSDDVGFGSVNFNNDSNTSGTRPISLQPGFIAAVPFVKMTFNAPIQVGKKLRIFYGTDIQFNPGISSFVNIGADQFLPTFSKFNDDVFTASINRDLIWDFHLLTNSASLTVIANQKIFFDPSGLPQAGTWDYDPDFGYWSLVVDGLYLDQSFPSNQPITVEYRTNDTGFTNSIRSNSFDGDNIIIPLYPTDQELQAGADTQAVINVPAKVYQDGDVTLVRRLYTIYSKPVFNNLALTDNGYNHLPKPIVMPCVKLADETQPSFCFCSPVNDWIPRFTGKLVFTPYSLFRSI